MLDGYKKCFNIDCTKDKEKIATDYDVHCTVSVCLVKLKY